MIDRIQDSTDIRPEEAMVTRLERVRESITAGNHKNMSKFLPSVFSLRGNPFTIREHYHFYPLFDCAVPPRRLFKTSRQIGKSENSMAWAILMANRVPHLQILCMLPFFQQARRLSHLRAAPLINESPMYTKWVLPGAGKSVLQRSFSNSSALHFSFGTTSVDRARGYSIDLLYLDEVQDMLPDNIAIVEQAMTASRDWEATLLTGTPKSPENLIQMEWNRSSQAEWIIKCDTGGCNSWNIPSIDHHLEMMIGLPDEDIGPNRAGLVCKSCRKPLRPHSGAWVHRFKEKAFLYPGYHISQPIVPLHYASPSKWATLYARTTGATNMGRVELINEVFGESAGSGQKLITADELQRACKLPWKNHPTTPDSHIKKVLSRYRSRCLAVDWGGNGEKGVSFTTAAVLGEKTNGNIDVIWGKRFSSTYDQHQEAMEILAIARMFSVDVLAHDFGGAGQLRETLLVQAGWPVNQTFPVWYMPPTATLCAPIQASAGVRAHYRVDRTRSLLIMCEAIRCEAIQFFQWDTVPGRDGLLKDFLNLLSNRSEGRVNRSIFTITKDPLSIDDFAHAVNIGCIATWYRGNSWPNFNRLAGKITDPDKKAALRGTQYAWAGPATEDDL